MTFDECCAIAKAYFEQFNQVLTSVSEHESGYVFTAKLSNGGVLFGGAPILVDKNTGTIRRLSLPHPESFQILDKAKPLELPAAYR